MAADAEEEKAETILNAAFAVFMAEGVPGLSYDAIAKQAGLSRQLIRYYYTDNEALMVALCDQMAARYRNALIEGVLNTKDSKRLDFFLDFYFDLLEEHPKPRDDQAYDAAFALAAGSAPIRANLCTQYGLLGHVVSHEIQLQFPDMKAEHCMELSYLFVCLMYGHWKMVASLGYSQEHKYITRRAMDRLLRSYDLAELEPAKAVRPWSLEV